MEQPHPGRDPHQVFISHAYEDTEFAHRLAVDLRTAGWRVWITPDSILPGEKWVPAINRGLEESGVFVVALTPAAVKSTGAVRDRHRDDASSLRRDAFHPVGRATLPRSPDLERLSTRALRW